MTYNREEIEPSVLDAADETSVSMSEKLHATLREGGYSIEVYTSSILGRKQDGPLVSELKLHFPRELKHTVLIDHTIIKRGKAAQTVRSVRKQTTKGAVKSVLTTLVKLPVCFTSLGINQTT